MRLRIGMGALLLAAPGTASAADFVTDIKAEGAQTSRYEDGREVIDNQMPLSSARVLEPKLQQPKRSGLRVFILNASGKPLNFGPENITIRLPDGSAVPMKTYAQLMAEQKKREFWQAFTAAMNSMNRGFQASQAGYSTSTATYSGNRPWMSGRTCHSIRPLRLN